MTVPGITNIDTSTAWPLQTATTPQEQPSSIPFLYAFLAMMEAEQGSTGQTTMDNPVAETGNTSTSDNEFLPTATWLQALGANIGQGSDNTNYVNLAGQGGGIAGNSAPTSLVSLDNLSQTSEISAPLTSQSIDSMISKAANMYGVPESLIRGVVRQESGFNPNATSAAGAEGLMQLMPSTAQSLGVTNALDPWQNIAGGTKYLQQLLNQFHGDIPLTLAAYNAGPGAVESHGGIPPYPETEAYVKSIMQSL